MKHKITILVVCFLSTFQYKLYAQSEWIVPQEEKEKISFYFFDEEVQEMGKKYFPAQFASRTLQILPPQPTSKIKLFFSKVYFL